MSDLTLPSLLDGAATSPRGVRLVGRDERDRFVSYEEIRDRARQTAAGLAERGILPGDRVAIILPTSVEFFDAFYGTLLLGAVPVPLYPPVRLGRMDEYHSRTSSMLQACQARLLLTNTTARLLLGETIRRAALELGALTVSRLGGGKPTPILCSPDALALIQFSSGTNSSPKPVRLTHRQVIANVEAVRAAILSAYPEGNGTTHIGASWLPLYHDMGLVGTVLTALAHPSDLVLTAPEVFVGRPEIWLRMISRFKATVSAAPNFAYSLCAERVPDEALEGVDLSSWRVALNGAEPVTPAVLDRFIERFRRFGLREEALTPVYGLAEAALAVTFSALHRRFRQVGFDRERLVREGVAVCDPTGHRLVSVGRALDGYAVRIVDDDWQALPADRIGRVVVRGPSITDGYDGRADLANTIRRGVWLDTGDAGFIHEGELFLYGRNKDLIVVRGRNYAPDDVEQSLVDLPGVRPGCWAAVGVVSEGEEGEQLAVLVERCRDRNPKKDAELADDVRGRIVERVGLSPSRVLVLEPGTLPRTTSGKIRRQVVKRQLAEGTLTAPKPVNAFRMAIELIRSQLANLRR